MRTTASAVLGGGGAAAGLVSTALLMPKTWDDLAIATLGVPRILQDHPSTFRPASHSRIPVAPIYKS